MTAPSDRWVTATDWSRIACLAGPPAAAATSSACIPPGKDGKTMRGSSAFEGGADIVYFTSRDGEVITLDREKRKDGPDADRHELKLGQIEGTASCVIELHRGTATTDRAKALSCTYDTCFAVTGCTPTSLREAAGMEKHTFYRALSDLLKAGELTNIGAEKRPFYKRPGDE